MNIQLMIVDTTLGACIMLYPVKAAAFEVEGLSRLLSNSCLPGAQLSEVFCGLRIR